jgi:Domain of unknown function (DUF5664)
MADTETKNFATGMQRSAAIEHLRFSSIHPVFTIALAKTLAEGATKYGDSNWELGSDIIDNLNHVEGHLAMYKAGDRSEPHLEHAACGLMFAVVNSILHPELSEHVLRGPGCTVTQPMKDHLEATKPERQRRREAGEFEHLGEWKLSEVPEIKAILSARKEAGQQ